MIDSTLVAADWVASREPAPPPQLAARVAALAAGVPGHVHAPPADGLVDAAEAAMRTLLREGCLTRESALDLLTVDAIVTYAFEAAADDAERLEARASAALARIAALAAPFHA